jgi:predicted transposase/invertase (TIGR01784 family)
MEQNKYYEMLNPLWDYCFKTVFASQRNIGNLTALLKAVLGLPPDELAHLTLADPYLKSWFQEDKYGILDARIYTKSNMVITVEVQISYSPAMTERILYYLSKLIWEQLKSGDSYALLRPVICIVICNYEMHDEADYLNQYMLRNEISGKLFTDLVKVVTIELPKVPEQDNGKALWPWLKYFKSRNEEEFEMLKEKHPEVSEAVIELRQMSQSEEERYKADTLEKWRRDRITWEYDAFNKGKAEGEAKGKVEGKAEVARNLKAIGIPVEKIAAVTGLSLDEIAKL